jgi:hypothetical protein
MTTNKKAKRAVRALAARTGHSYQGALRAVIPLPGLFERIVLQVLRLAKARDDESARRKAEGREMVGVLGDLLDPTARPARMKLWDYLTSQTTEDTFKLNALMYAGRDAVSLIDEEESIRRIYLGCFIGPRAKSVARIQMMEKSPLVRYLQAGMHAARDQHVDIEGAFGRKPEEYEDDV